MTKLTDQKIRWIIREKMKDDAIAHLSDQLIALTARLDSIERRQH